MVMHGDAPEAKSSTTDGIRARAGLIADIAAVAIAALAFARNLDLSRIVLGWDIDGSFLNAPLALHRALSSWTDHVGLGSDTTPSHGAIPIYGFQALLHTLHASPGGIEWTTFGLLYLSVPLAMLLYCRTVFPHDVELRLIATLCATFNFYHAITWYTPLAVYEAGLAAGLATAAAVVAFAHRRTLLTALGLLAATVLTATAGSNAAVAAVVLALTACLIAIAIKRRPELLRHIVVPLSVFLGMSLFWLAPLVNFYSTQQAPIRSSDYVTSWSDYALTATSEAATIPNVIRLIGTWDWTHADDHGHKYVRFADAYDRSVVLLALSFIVPLLASLALLRVRCAPVRLALIAAAAALFLMKGTAPPFGQLYEFAYRHMPGFLVFRVPYSKFGLAAAPLMALLAGIGFSAVTERLPAVWKIAAASLTGLAIAASVSSGWSGLMFRHNEYMPTYYVRMPKSYFALADVLNRRSDQQRRGIVLPFSPQLSFTAFDWDFNGPDPLSYLVNRPLIIEPAAWAEGSTRIALADIDRTPQALSWAATENAIGYAIIHRDIVPSFYNARSAQETENLVKAAGFTIRWVSADGKLALYERRAKRYTGIDFSGRGSMLATGPRAAARSFFGSEVFGPAGLSVGSRSKAISLSQAPFVCTIAAERSHRLSFRCPHGGPASRTALRAFKAEEVFYDGMFLQPDEPVTVTEGWHQLAAAEEVRSLTPRTVALTPTRVSFRLRAHTSARLLILSNRGNNGVGATVRVTADGQTSVPNAISIDGPLHRVILFSAKQPLRDIEVQLTGPGIASLARARMFHFAVATRAADLVLRFPPMLMLDGPRASIPPASIAVFSMGAAGQAPASGLQSRVIVVDGAQTAQVATPQSRVALRDLERGGSDSGHAAWVPAAGYVSLGSITNDQWLGDLDGARMIKADRLGLYNAWYVPHAGLVRFRYGPETLFELYSLLSLLACALLFALGVQRSFVEPSRSPAPSQP